MTRDPTTGRFTVLASVCHRAASTRAATSRQRPTRVRLSASFLVRSPVCFHLDRVLPDAERAPSQPLRQGAQGSKARLVFGGLRESHRGSRCFHFNRRLSEGQTCQGNPNLHCGGSRTSALRASVHTAHPSLGRLLIFSNLVAPDGLANRAAGAEGIVDTIHSFCRHGAGLKADDFARAGVGYVETNDVSVGGHLLCPSWWGVAPFDELYIRTPSACVNAKSGLKQYFYRVEYGQ